MKGKTKNNNMLYLFPIIFALGYIPIFVHEHVYDTNLAQFEWFSDASATQIDFFLYYKMVAIIVTGVIMVVLLGKLYFDRNKMKIESIWYSLFAYGILCFMSALFSEYRYFSFHGSYELFESIWVLLGYVIMAFFTYQMIQNETDVMTVFKYSLWGILLVSIIGFFQYFGLDLFRSTIGKLLITNPDLWKDLDSLSFTFPLKTSYTTLYNTNYLPFYFGMFLPIVILMILFEKNTKLKCLCAILSVLFIVNMIGSNSKSGLIAAGIALLFGCVLFFKDIMKKKWVVILLAIAFLLMITVFSVRYGGISNLAGAIFKGTQSVANEYPIKDIDTNDNDVTFYYKDHELHVAYEFVSDSQGIVIHLWDKDGTEIDYTLLEDGMTRVVNHSDFGYCTITPVYIDNLMGIQIHIDDQDWYFTNQIDGTYYYYNACQKYVKINDYEISSLFPNSFFSGRGHLWNKVLPTLKNYIIFGIGANNFLFSYPQDDYVEKANTSMLFLFDVKAHNLYLQQFVENGFLALVAFLVFYIWYFISSFKLYFNQEDHSRLSVIGSGILLGTVIYMILGLANDSNVNTAPVFWVMIGMGLAINRILKNNHSN